MEEKTRESREQTRRKRCDLCHLSWQYATISAGFSFSGDFLTYRLPVNTTSDVRGAPATVYTFRVGFSRARSSGSGEIGSWSAAQSNTQQAFQSVSGL